MDSKPKSFNKAIYFNPQKNLHDAPLQTARKLYSVEKFVDLFSDLEPSYDNLPFFKETYRYFSAYSKEELKEKQKQFLDLINHDQFATMFPAFIEKPEMAERKDEAELAFRSAIRFARDLAAGHGVVEKFREFMERKSPAEAKLIDSILATSLYNYGRFCNPEDAKRYAARASAYPLYAECGIDFMYGAYGWALAELQFSYQSYPHNLHTLHRGSTALFPDLMAGVGESTFPARRLAALEQFIASIPGEKARRIMLDAWTATMHPTRNYMELAKQLDAPYLLFDDFARRPEGLKYAALVEGDAPAFIFNQPLLYFLDPVWFFEPILHERLEEYTDIQLHGLFEDYMQGKVHLANPPLIDILNDKAIYRLLPYLAEFYQGARLKTPISTPQPLWSEENPLAVNEGVFSQVLANKDVYVICHRYLEAGGGIRIGPEMTQVEWVNFLETYVREKPFLFVCRDYLPMNPDVSFRVYCCGNFDQENKASIESSDEMLGRINPSGSLLKKSYFFLCAQKS